MDGKILLILHKFKQNRKTGETIVDFTIIIDPSYINEALRVANNNLGENQKNSGLNFLSSVIKGKRIHCWLEPSRDAKEMITLQCRQLLF